MFDERTSNPFSESSIADRVKQSRRGGRKSLAKKISTKLKDSNMSMSGQKLALNGQSVKKLHQYKQCLEVMQSLVETSTAAPKF